MDGHCVIREVNCIPKDGHCVTRETNYIPKDGHCVIREHKHTKRMETAYHQRKLD
jgi:hypothetical protein